VGLLPSSAVLLLGRARVLSARLVSHRDEQGSDVFAVLPRLAKRRAGTGRRDTFSAELDHHLVRLGVGALDATGSLSRIHMHAVHDAPLFVIQAAQEGASTQQAA
jgi:hypothetical protein